MKGFYLNVKCKLIGLDLLGSLNYFPVLTSVVGLVAVVCLGILIESV